MAIPFFGIGAMRSGTTWLSELLGSYPDCAMSPFKELHFFDVRYGLYDGERRYRLQLQALGNASAKAVKRGEAALDVVCTRTNRNGNDSDDFESFNVNEEYTPWPDEKGRELYSHAELDKALGKIEAIVAKLSIRDIRSYAEYLRRHGAGASAFGEITPSYALLPSAAFAEMDELFPDARFIFIMRDPVDRLWSHVRRKTAKAERRRDTKRDANREFRETLEKPSCILRSSYDRTIKEAERVIPQKRMLYLFYEELTSAETGPAQVRRIENTLGLNPKKIDQDFFATNVNSSPGAELDPDNELAALELLAPAYEFVAKRFGHPKGWRSLRKRQKVRR